MAITRTGTPTQGTWDATSWVPELYANKVLYDFWIKSVYQDVTNTDYEGDFKNMGDKIYIRQAPEIAVGDYTVNGTVTYELPSEASQTMTIDYAKYTAFKCDDIDKLQTDIDLLSMYAEDGANRLRVEIDDIVLTEMGSGAHASNKGATAGLLSGDLDLGSNATPGTTDAVQVTSTNAVTKIVEANLCLDEQNIDSTERFGIIPSWWSAMLKLGDLKAANITGDQTGVIRNGLIGQIDGSNIYVSNNLNSNADGDSDTGYESIFGRKEATSFAMQISKSDTVTLENSFGTGVRTLIVFGTKVIRPEALVNIFVKKETPA
ncbi:hypothetical protein DRQ25_11880 [Candidatus Fermentibacteria bacterium]|nr:MAG: hypothetical protein DRQ25_11880 [Candidatus Fermentibacteria bacterium]